MLIKHFILYFIFIILLSFHVINCESASNTSLALRILKNVVKLTDTLLEVNPYINITVSAVPPNCVQMLCKYVCFNGRSSEIAKDIEIVSEKNNLTCNSIEELRLYNYEFPNKKLSYGFLGTYSDKVKVLYLGSANITDIETGSFANGIFREIYFENLKLTELKKEFFHDISTDFQSLSIVQKEEPLEVVYPDFLSYVKYQIKYLTMQVGLSCVHNLTGGESLLNNLIYVDVSFNNIQHQLVESTFSKLSMVEHLDLSNSNLEYLPPYIFSEFTSTLEYLDLSHNKLKTITRSVFGWREIPRELKIYASDNEWYCSCDLQQEMKDIFVYQTTKLVCSEPAEFLNWSVFDDALCDGRGGWAEVTVPNSAKSTTALVVDEEEPLESTEAVLTTSLHYTDKPNSSVKDEFQNLECVVGASRHDHSMKMPLLHFVVSALENLSANVAIAATSTLNDSFGLIWFSKVTKEYYKMEINYNDYGLGCYGAISYNTIVDGLTPNMAYTFCIVLKHHMAVSPFSCKSIHIGSNLSIQYNAWLTRDMKVTGLSLVVFGIVMFSFAGILMIYLLLKRRPILLKGSKRVTTPRGNSGDIVVLPKKQKSFKEKEEKLASQSPFSCSQKRRNSNESVASYQSYINTNLYEVIPAHNTLNASSVAPPSPQLQISTTDCDSSDMECCYLTPLNTVSSSADLVNYAEIPYCAKRVSNDPLPEIPADQAPQSLNSGESLEKPEYTDVGLIYMLDSHV